MIRGATNNFIKNIGIWKKEIPLYLFFFYIFQWIQQVRIHNLRPGVGRRKVVLELCEGVLNHRDGWNLNRFPINATQIEDESSPKEKIAISALILGNLCEMAWQDLRVRWTARIAVIKKRRAQGGIEPLPATSQDQSSL